MCKREWVCENTSRDAATTLLLSYSWLGWKQRVEKETRRSIILLYTKNNISNSMWTILYFQCVALQSFVNICRIIWQNKDWKNTERPIPVCCLCSSSVNIYLCSGVYPRLSRVSSLEWSFLLVTFLMIYDYLFIPHTNVIRNKKNELNICTYVYENIGVGIIV